MAIEILHDKDANLDLLKGLTVAVMGYGSQGEAQAKCMRDSGVNVIIGLRESGKSWGKAKEDGFTVLSFKDAAEKADIIHILLPDEHHKKVYDDNIAQHMKPGKVLSCSHGFNVVYKRIVPPEGVDVIMVAPKSPGPEVRNTYVDGFGVPGLIAAYQDASGKAWDIALAIAKAEGLTRAGVLKCTFEQETYEDLFGEQTVLCGGIVDLIKYGFETLTEAGYPPEMAYFECLHETKLIVDLIYKGGIQMMNEAISNTAEWGEYQTGPRIITPAVKKNMKKALKEIENGTFAKKWMAEAENGCPNLLKKREALASHPIEIVGKKIRSLFERK